MLERAARANGLQSLADCGCTVAGNPEAKRPKAWYVGLEGLEALGRPLRSHRMILSAGYMPILAERGDLPLTAMRHEALGV